MYGGDGGGGVMKRNEFANKSIYISIYTYI